MPVFFDTGEIRFETHDVDVAIGTNAGAFASSIIPLDRPGRFVTAMVSVQDGATSEFFNGLGRMSVNTDGGGNLDYGDQVSSFTVRISKVATATSGTVTTRVLIITAK